MNSHKTVVNTLLASMLAIAGCGDPSGQGLDESHERQKRFTAFVGGTLIDGTGAPAIENAVVLVSGDKIVSVGTQEATHLPASTDIVDTAGRWIVPGLVDAHTHFFESGRIYTKPPVLDLTHLVPYEDEIAWMKRRVPVTLQSYLCAGVTSSVSLGGPRFEFEVKEQAGSATVAPNVFAAHGPLTLVSAEQLFPPFDGDTALRSVTDVASAAETVRQGAKWGADLIKTGYLGGPFAAAEADFVVINEAIVAEAHRLDLRVTAHVMELSPARELVKAGVDSLQHVPADAVVDKSFLEITKSQRVVVVPTLAVFQRDAQISERSVDLLDIERRCGDPEVIQTWSEVDDELPELTQEMKDHFAAFDELVNRNTKALYEAGVPLAAGSDAGNFGLLHGPSLHYELKLMGRAGIPPMDLIVAATLNAARVAGQEDNVGSLEPGKLADFVLLTADPLTDVANLQAIESVVKGGVVLAHRDLLPDKGAIRK